MQLGSRLRRKLGGRQVIFGIAKTLGRRGNKKPGVALIQASVFRSDRRASRVFFKGPMLTPLHMLIIGSGLSLAIGLGGLFFIIRPLQHHINNLAKEKAHWREVLSAPRERGRFTVIPTMEKLPDSLEECRSYFLEPGVDVKAFTVERFASASGSEVSKDYGEIKGNAGNAQFDFALVRMHWQGSWENIVKGLVKIEEAPDLGISVQEVQLDKDGGQGVFRLYFRDR